MVCTLVIDAGLLKNPLVYKYVVFSPQVTAPDECYEKLHSFARWNYDPNRCLWLSTEAYNKAYGGMQFLAHADQLFCVCTCDEGMSTVNVFAHQAYLLTSPGLKSLDFKFCMHYKHVMLKHHKKCS